jgi:hypothetical protein
MGSRRSAVVAAVGIGVVAAGLIAGASASAGTGDDETVLVFDVQTSPFDLTDLGEPGLSAADQIVFHDQLLQDGNHVGHQVGGCVLVDAEAFANCTGVVTLDGRGTITYAFENAPPPEKTVAITGGSGDFRAAHGDGVFLEAEDQTATLTLTLVRR